MRDQQIAGMLKLIQRSDRLLEQAVKVLGKVHKEEIEVPDLVQIEFAVAGCRYRGRVTEQHAAKILALATTVTEARKILRRILQPLLVQADACIMHIVPKLESVPAEDVNTGGPGERGSCRWGAGPDDCIYTDKDDCITVIGGTYTANKTCEETMKIAATKPAAKKK